MTEEEQDGFLSRWSRRKRSAAAAPAPVESPPDEPKAAEAPPPAEALAKAPATDGRGAERPACAIPNLPEIDLASLPKIEELTDKSDFSVFLQPGVPSVLRNAALRRMWSLDPAIRDYIGPVDYQWDFNSPGGLPFGFANELGGEVQKLLAQAIGRMTEEDAAEDRETPPVAEPDLAPPGPEAPPAATLVAETGPDSDIVQAPQPVSLEGEDMPEAARPVLSRRRHGGALPV